MDGLGNNSKIVRDKFGRPLEYLRLSVTDRCNLRCFYCMPNEKMKFLPRRELLSFEELEVVVRELVELGIKKIRITGGEPFVRKDLIKFLSAIRRKHPGLEIAITSNGVLLGQFLQEIMDLQIRKINLSLDTLDPGKFLRITARDDFEKVQACLFQLIESGFETKVNFVVMKGVNDDEIVQFGKLAKDLPVSVRFIEEMPFNGLGKQRGFMSHEEIKSVLKEEFGLEQFTQADPFSSSFDSKEESFVGSVGVIPAYSRTFCGSCNRIRISATGKIKTCLYGKDELDLRQLIRSGSESIIQDELIKAFQHRYENGIEAEKESEYKSMSIIGG